MLSVNCVAFLSLVLMVNNTVLGSKFASPACGDVRAHTHTHAHTQKKTGIIHFWGIRCAQTTLSACCSCLYSYIQSPVVITDIQNGLELP